MDFNSLFTPTNIVIGAVCGIALLLAILRLLPRIFEGVGAMQSFDRDFDSNIGKNWFGRDSGGGDR